MYVHARSFLCRLRSGWLPLASGLTAAVVAGMLMQATEATADPAGGRAATQPSQTSSMQPTEGGPSLDDDQSATAASAGSAGQASSSGGWWPSRNVVFNNPYGGPEARFRIERKVLRAIRNTPKGEVIRISVYSFDRRDVAEALIEARRRGVRVQILLNDHQVTREQRMLRRVLGGNPSRLNFSYECRASCRGRRDNLHSKFFLFSRTGRAKHVVMTGSTNFTLNAVKWQWNDLLTRHGNQVLFWDFVRLFNDMRRDYAHNRPYYIFCGKAEKICHPNEDYAVGRVFPRLSGPRSDVVLNMLRPIQCHYWSDGVRKRTRLRLSMHTMQGERGEYIARRVRNLWADGCNVKVLYGLMGWHVKRELGAVTRRGRIPLRSTGYDYNDDFDMDRYTHQKYFTVHGKYNGAITNISFTGSSNWSSRGSYGDEIIFSVRGGGIVRGYEDNFDFMYGSRRHSRNAYTTTAQNYRKVVTVPGPDGEPVQKVVTVTRLVQLNLPDRLRGAGPRWEGD